MAHTIEYKGNKAIDTSYLTTGISTILKCSKGILRVDGTADMNSDTVIWAINIARARLSKKMSRHDYYMETLLKGSTEDQIVLNVADNELGYFIKLLSIWVHKDSSQNTFNHHTVCVEEDVCTVEVFVSALMEDENINALVQLEVL